MRSNEKDLINNFYKTFPTMVFNFNENNNYYLFPEDYFFYYEN